MALKKTNFQSDKNVKSIKLWFLHKKWSHCFKHHLDFSVVTLLLKTLIIKKSIFEGKIYCRSQEFFHIAFNTLLFKFVQILS